MPSKRITPQWEVDRLAERIYNDFGEEIEDEDTFNKAYKMYMDEDLTNKQRTILRKEVFKAIRVLNPDITAPTLHEKAGGKNLVQDREKTAKEIVTTKEEYIKKGAKNVDLKGYDTKRKLKRTKPITKDFTYIAVKKSKRTGRRKRVFARKTPIVRNGKQINVYRDAGGRFVKRS